MTKATSEPRPGSPTGLHEVRRSLSGRRLIVFGIVCVVLLGCGIGTLLYLGPSLDTTNTTEPITVTDANKIVTIDLPAGWENTTAKDAGQISTEGDSGDSVPPYRVPDTSAYRDFADADEKSGSWLDVTIEILALGTSNQEQHVAQVQKVIEDYDATFTPSKTIPDISGYPALRSSGNVAGSASDLFVITIFGPEYSVTITGDTALHREPGWDNLSADPRREELARLVSQARIP